MAGDTASRQKENLLSLLQNSFGNGWFDRAIQEIAGGKGFPAGTSAG